MYLSDSETVKQNNVKYSYLSSTERKLYRGKRSNTRMKDIHMKPQLDINFPPSMHRIIFFNSSHY